MFLDVTLPFNLIVAAKTSAQEQFERPPFWKPCWRLGRIVWRHRAQEAKFQEDNITKCKMVGVVAVQTGRPEILREG